MVDLGDEERNEIFGYVEEGVSAVERLLNEVTRVRDGLKSGEVSLDEGSAVFEQAQDLLDDVTAHLDNAYFSLREPPPKVPEGPSGSVPPEVRIYSLTAEDVGTAYDRLIAEETGVEADPGNRPWDDLSHELRERYLHAVDTAFGYIDWVEIMQGALVQVRREMQTGGQL